jgi:PAS domain S-box-containing protein
MPTVRAEPDPQEAELHRLAVEWMEDIVALATLDRRTLFISPSYYRITGWTPDEVRATDFRQRVHPDDLPAVEDARQRNLSGERTRIEWRCRCKDGRYLWLETTANPIHDAADRVQRIALCSRRIDDRKAAEEAAHASEDRYRMMVESLAEGVLVVDATGTITACNTSAAQIAATPVEQMLGASIVDPRWQVVSRDGNLVSPEAYPMCVTLRTGRPVEGWVIGVRRPDGSLLWIRGSTRPLTQLGASQVSGVVASYSDVSDLIRTEQELAEAKLELERRVAERSAELHAANEQLRENQALLAHAQRVSTTGELAAGLIHEIGQPMAAVAHYAHGFARRLQADAPPLDELRSAAAELVGEADRATEVLRRLRGFVRRFPPQRLAVELPSVMREVAALLASDVRRRSIALTWDVAAELPAVFVDPIQVQQVLVNLLRNAFDAVADCSSGERRVAVRAVAEPAGVIVIVRDCGDGLPDDGADRLFEPFYSTKSDGLGLGLPICRTIVEAHEGRIWAQPAEPRGAEFCVLLPIAT